LAFQSEPNQKKALMEIIAEFEKEYDCKIMTTELSWNDGKQNYSLLLMLIMLLM
jgi:acyl carrier protein